MGKTDSKGKGRIAEKKKGRMRKEGQLLQTDVRSNQYWAIVRSVRESQYSN